MEGYMTTSQAAEALGVTTARIYSLIREGKLEADRFGHGYAVRAESVERRKRSNPGPGNPDFREPGYHGRPRKPPKLGDGEMRIDDAAAALGVSGARVRQLIGEGQLAWRKVDGVTAVSEESVAEYASRRRRKRKE